MYRLFLLLLLLHTSIIAADVNATIAEGNRDYYEKLLYQVNQSDQKSDELSLQKTLLYKLINLLSAEVDKTIDLVIPKDVQSYHEVFEFYIELSYLKVEQEQRLKQMQANKKMMKGEIELTQTNDRSILSKQLQYAFYHKGELIYTKKKQARESQMQNFPYVFIDSFSNIEFDINKTRSAIDKLTKDYQKHAVDIEKFKLDQERLNLLEKADQANRYDDSMSYLEQAQEKLALEKVLLLFDIFSFSLKHEKENVFNIENQLLEEVLRLNRGFLITEDITLLVQSMSREVLGTAKRFQGAMFTEIKNTLMSVWAFINEPLFLINETYLTLLKMVIAIFIFGLSFYLGGFYKKLLHKHTYTKRSMKLATRTLLSNVGNYIIIISAFFLSLNILGINLSSFALIAGALSVGIGFGLQNIVANFVAGLVLMFERSIKVGDYIEITDQLKGQVMDIRMRSTTINTNSNIDVIVPNQDLIQKHVINWTMSDDIKRYDIPFSVAYGTDTNKVLDVILNAVKECGFDDLYESNRYHSQVVMTGMNHSGVDFELLVWLKGNNILSPKTTISRFLILIYKTLNENGIEIPFPQRDLHIRSIEDDVQLTITRKAF